MKQPPTAPALSCAFLTRPALPHETVQETTHHDHEEAL